MEFSLIDRIRQLTAQHRDDVRLGIGDDAALLTVPPGQELAVAIDTHNLRPGDSTSVYVIRQGR